MNKKEKFLLFFTVWGLSFFLLAPKVDRYLREKRKEKDQKELFDQLRERYGARPVSVYQFVPHDNSNLADPDKIHEL